jgi:hypothetical protein
MAKDYIIKTLLFPFNSAQIRSLFNWPADKIFMFHKTFEKKHKFLILLTIIWKFKLTLVFRTRLFSLIHDFLSNVFWKKNYVS